MIDMDTIPDRSHQYSGEENFRNSDEKDKSNYDTMYNHRPGVHTQQKPQPVRLRPVSELRRVFSCSILS
jgi:ATP-dependent DNA helicase HFM1/MER3